MWWHRIICLVVIGACAVASTQHSSSGGSSCYDSPSSCDIESSVHSHSMVDRKGAVEKTFIAIKPDGVQRGLVAEIIGRMEKRGFKLVGMKMLKPSVELAATHYDEHKGKPFFPSLVQYMSEGPVVVVCWQGVDIISTSRAIIGETNPLVAAPGTIRGDFAISVGRNIVHGSDSITGAERELALWFQPNEILDWNRALEDYITATN